MPVVSPTPRVRLRSSSRRVPRVHAARMTAAEADAEPNMRLSRAILVMLLLHVVAVGGVLAFDFFKDRESRRTGTDHVDLASNAVEAEDSHLPARNDDVNAMHRKPGATETPAHANIHVVRAGETLMRIANDHGVTLEALVAANGAETVTSGLHPGQELRLPDKSPEPEPQLPDNAANALNLIEGRSNAGVPRAAGVPSGKTVHPLPSGGKTYVVAKGDTPAGIAKKLKVSADALLKLNQIDDPKKLKPGQKLRLPDTAKAPDGRN